jgi:head-tail adaptor
MSGGIVRRFKPPKALLSDLVDVEAPTDTADGQGGFTTTWTTIATDVPTLISNSSPGLGDLLVFAGALAQQSTHRLWFRDAVPGLTPKCRLHDKTTGRHWRIRSIGQYAGSFLILGEEMEAA